MGNARDGWEASHAETNGCLGNIFGGIVGFYLFVGFLRITPPVLEFLGLFHYVKTLPENHPIIFFICALVVFVATLLIIGFAIDCLIKLVAFILRKIGLIS